eukprot:CFRG2263T1
MVRLSSILWFAIQWHIETTQAWPSLDSFEQLVSNSFGWTKNVKEGTDAHAINTKYGNIVKANNGTSVSHPAKWLTQAEVDEIHRAQKSWTAVDPSKGEWNLFVDMSEEDMMSHVMKPRRLHSADENDSHGPIHVLPVRKVNVEFWRLPSHFDAREKWYDCQPISFIRDQVSGVVIFVAIN